MADQPQVTCVADVKAVLGEGPVWVERERALYSVDINARRIFRLDGAGAVRSWDTSLRVGSLAPRAGGGFIAGTDRGLAFADLESGSFEVFANPDEALPSNRFNDGKVDRAGRFWAGTMDDEERRATGTLYRIDGDRRVTAIDANYRVSNGPAFSPDGRIMYHSDTARQVTYAFDLDEAGNPSNRREFIRFGKGDGYPDGMTVDAEGCLWNAQVYDGKLIRYRPDGKVDRVIDMPVKKVTSVMFGGPELRHLFVTSARMRLDPAALAAQKLAGHVFMFQPGALGLPEPLFRG
jgi:sugar lactone lactonase YvrE